MTRSSGLLIPCLLAAACSGPPATATDDAPAAQAAARAEAPAAEHADVAALRAATARFQRIEVAHQAGYAVQFPAGCFESDEGAMGFHFLNESLVGTLDPTRPQLVMYEPQRNGTMKLVGVEFIAPGSPDDTPPMLFGQDFAWNDVFEVWVLHVWTWKHNPAGPYQGWNPTVSCEHAASVSLTAHH